MVSNSWRILGVILGVVMGVVCSNPSVELPEWPLLAAIVTIGLGLFPVIIVAFFQLHRSLGTWTELSAPCSDGFSLSAKRPLDVLNLVATLSFWQGLGVSIVSALCWPHFLVLGVAMMLGYYSTWIGIHWSLSLFGRKEIAR